MQRKREQEFGWEDITDTAFMPLPQPLPSRFWRAPERLYRYSEGRKPAEIITFDQYPSPFIQIVGQRYRKRIGRGGRIHLDRLASRRVASDASDEEGGDEDAKEEVMQRMRERWRYDADIPQELPSTRYPMVLDDFDTKFAATRSRMLAASDWESVYPATVHIEEAMHWTMREPDRPPPMQVVGKLPGQRMHAMVNGQGNGGHNMMMNNGQHQQHQHQQQQPQPHHQHQHQQHQQQLAGQMSAAAAAAVAAAAAANSNSNNSRMQPLAPLQQQQQQQQNQVQLQGPMAVQGQHQARRSNSVGGQGGGGGMNSPQPAAPSPGGLPPQPPQIRRLMMENGS